MPVEQDVETTIELVAAAVRDRRCILFLGAGVHAPPADESPFEYPAELRPPIGAALSEQLARTSGLAEQFPRDMDGYVDGKDAFIKNVEIQALAWAARGSPKIC